LLLLGGAGYGQEDEQEDQIESFHWSSCYEVYPEIAGAILYFRRRTKGESCAASCGRASPEC